MQGKLEGFADNQGYPRYNEGARALECGSGVSISCDIEQCNVVVFTDSNGNTSKVFATPIIVSAKNEGSQDCPTQSDTRLTNIGKEPYVQIIGFKADTDSDSIEQFKLSLFPEIGQTASELRTAIIEALCTCSNAGRL